MRHSRGARTFSIGELGRVLMLGFRLHTSLRSARRRFPPFTFWFTPKNTGESASACIIRGHRLVDDRLAGNELRAHFPTWRRGDGSDGEASGGWEYEIDTSWLASCTDQSANCRTGATAWPPDMFSSWRPDDTAKVRLFVFVYLWAGCDFLPAVSHLPFLKMWKYARKSVRPPGLFAKRIFVQESVGCGPWTFPRVLSFWLRHGCFSTKQRSSELKQNHRTTSSLATVTSNSTPGRSRV